jgi:hypothetical protein
MRNPQYNDFFKDQRLGQRSLVPRLGAARHNGENGSSSIIFPKPQSQSSQAIENVI